MHSSLRASVRSQHASQAMCPHGEADTPISGRGVSRQTGHRKTIAGSLPPLLSWPAERTAGVDVSIARFCTAGTSAGTLRTALVGMVDPQSVLLLAPASSLPPAEAPEERAAVRLVSNGREGNSASAESPRRGLSGTVVSAVSIASESSHSCPRVAARGFLAGGGAPATDTFLIG
jgi:hypothetical protein